MQEATIPRHNRFAAYNRSAKGKARRKRYRHDNSKWQTDASYLSRPIVGWDGEGITLPDGSHIYVLFMNSEGASIADPDGLSTRRIFDFMLSEYAKYPDAIHCIYGGGYDANMWLSDLSRELVKGIYSHNYYRLGDYTVQWRRGKSFYLRYGDDKGMMVYDVLPFFQCPFVKACDEYLGADFYERDLIVKNKALRSSFTHDDISEVTRYTSAELVNLVRLVTELRARLNKVGLRPKRWDGPGAIAAALLKREGVKKARAECPEPVAEAARYAYAGGRFEVIRFGNVDAPAYEYDVNSAYPYALQHVPNLRTGTWQHLVTVDNRHKVDRFTFGLYRVEYRGTDPAIPGPLFRRHVNGAISYPLYVTGWFWAPDIHVAQKYVRRYGGHLHILEAWVYSDDGSRPFDFIPRLYAKRRALKAAGDGAHVGIKLGLNSLYGKLAQQVGWRMMPDGPRIPPFHQLEWAGFTTSVCRSLVLSACLSDLESVIAFETDAVFTSSPLPVKTGTDLGEWEETRFDSLTYAQSGMYFGTVAGKQVTKTRGVDRGTMTREQVEAAMLEPVAERRHVNAQLTRFIGAGLALQTSWETWRRWITAPKRMIVEPTGKRWHSPGCPCDSEGPIIPGMWHETLCPFLNETGNAEYPVEWINPDPAMVELAELRENEPDETLGEW